MKRFFRIFGFFIIIFAVSLFALRGMMGISFLMGDKDFYPPAGQFLSPETKAFNFTILSDTGSQNRTLERLIRDARDNHSPAFMLHLGDLVVYRNIEHMYWIMDEIDAKLKGIPMYLVPGNHDVKKRKKVDKSIFKRVFGHLYYWFGFGNTLFIGLDSSTEKIDDEQWAFYEQVMKKVRSKFKYVILFTHVPPCVPEGAHPHALKPEHVSKMAEMLKRYPVDAIFSGHVHYYSKQNFHGIPVYTVPPSGQYFGGSVRQFGYLDVKVDQRGIHVADHYNGDRKKKSELIEMIFIDLILTNKVRWIAGICLVVGLFFLLSGQKWIHFRKKK